jgi:hypothetical protein
MNGIYANAFAEKKPRSTVGSTGVVSMMTVYTMGGIKSTPLLACGLNSIIMPTIYKKE